MATINPADLTPEQLAIYQLNTGTTLTTESAPVEINASDVQAFGTPTATDIVGPTNNNTTVQAFGTPTATDVGGQTTETTAPNNPTVSDVDMAAVMPAKEEETPGPTEQDVIDAEQDPEEKLRMYAAQQEQEAESSPTEQEVIDTTDEPQMTKEDQAALEKQQADNRAKLRAEETSQPFSSGKVVPLPPAKDWRVRMSIAPTLSALYNVASGDDILLPLKATGGVVFPYTPTIQTGYKANYEVSELVHTNYKNYFYKNSSVDDLTITAEFTAQDQKEAQYLLAVMHFFRTVTKMFYGQDKSPNAGTPPPLVFLSGFGAYQYDNHPVLISSFSYTLPNDVDYIRTTSNGGYSSTGISAANNKGGLTGLATTASKFGFSGISNMLSGVNRLMSAGLNKGGSLQDSTGTIKAISNKFNTTYVPTKIQFSISAYPIVTRRDISQNFSLEKYAKGTIYRGSQRGGSGIW